MTSLAKVKRDITHIRVVLSPTPIAPNEVVVVDQLPVNYLELDNPTLRTLRQIFGGEDLSLPEEDIRDYTKVNDERKSLLKPGDVTPSLYATVKNERRFRALRSEQWFQKYQELVRYRETHRDCLVPPNASTHKSLSQWAKRQRYQYKLREEGKHSNLTDERKQALESIGFVWNTQGAKWEDRFEELLFYLELHGHCNVPKDYTANRALSVWVKCQRRLYKMTLRGKQPLTALTQERINKLNNIGFSWGRLEVHVERTSNLPRCSTSTV
jgi:hypothetical protein